MKANKVGALRLADAGLQEMQGDGSYLTIAPYIKVLGEGIVDEIDQFVTVIRYQANDGKKRRLIVPRAELQRRDALLARLMNGGYSVPPATDRQTCLMEHLQKPTKLRYRIVARTGYAGGAYVRGDGKVVARTDDKITVLYDPFSPPRFEHAAIDGTMDGWVKLVAKPAMHSSRMMCSISLSLASLLIHPLEGESGVFHFYGPSSVGKSLLELAALSVHERACREDLPHWDVTSTALDELAAEHCDRLLVLDDTGGLATNLQKASALARRAAFKIAGGVGRIRSASFGRYGNQCRWRVYVISSGEQGISELAAAAGRKRLKGDEVRMIDIPAQGDPRYGIFDTVPSGSSSANLVAMIEEGCRMHYGHAADKFLKKLQADQPGAVRLSRKYVDGFMEEAGVAATGWERRFARRFGIAYAAGRLGISWRILPWDRDELRSAITEVYRSARAAVPDLEQQVDEALAKIKRCLRSRKRLRDLRKGADREGQPKAAKASGFIRTDPKRSGQALYIVKPPALLRWIGGNQSLLPWVGRWLIENRMLQTTSRGLPTKQVDIAGVKERRRYYCIKGKFVA